MRLWALPIPGLPGGGARGRPARPPASVQSVKGPRQTAQGSRWHTVEGPHHCHCQVSVGIKHRAEQPCLSPAPLTINLAPAPWDLSLRSGDSQELGWKG